MTQQRVLRRLVPGSHLEQISFRRGLLMPWFIWIFPWTHAMGALSLEVHARHAGYGTEFLLLI